MCVCNVGVIKASLWEFAGVLRVQDMLPAMLPMYGQVRFIGICNIFKSRD